MESNIYTLVRVFAVATDDQKATIHGRLAAYAFKAIKSRNLFIPNRNGSKLDRNTSRYRPEPDPTWAEAEVAALKYCQEYQRKGDEFLTKIGLGTFAIRHVINRLRWLNAACRRGIELQILSEPLYDDNGALLRETMTDYLVDEDSEGLTPGDDVITVKTGKQKKLHDVEGIQRIIDRHLAKVVPPDSLETAQSVVETVAADPAVTKGEITAGVAAMRKVSRQQARANLRKLQRIMADGRKAGVEAMIELHRELEPKRLSPHCLIVPPDAFVFVRDDEEDHAGRTPHDGFLFVPKDLSLMFDTTLGVLGIGQIIRDAARTGKIDLVIFDPFRRMLHGDENSSAVTAALWRQLDEWGREFHCAFAFSHHIVKPPRDGQSKLDETSPFAGRGSGDIFAGGDAFINVVPVSKRKMAHSHPLKLYFQTKRAAPICPVNLRLDIPPGTIHFEGFVFGKPLAGGE